VRSKVTVAQTPQRKEIYVHRVSEKGSVPFRRNPIRRILEKYTVRVVAVVL